jgi:hypothetical protein
MSEKRQWSDLTALQRRAIIGAGTAQIGLLVAALLDIRRRPAKQIRGPKKLWTAASFVNFVGPIAYFVAGRKR